MGLIDAPPLEPAASRSPLGRPHCPKCRARPTIQNVIQIRSGFDYLTLRCTSCGLVYDAQVTQVPSDPLQSEARGWINSKLMPSK